MPRGTKRIEKIAEAAKARSDAYNSGAGFLNSLVLQKGETAKGRFLEEGNDVWFLYTHELPPKQGQNYGDRILCLDQPFTSAEEETYIEGRKECPGCELEGISRTARVIINFLRYDEPKLRREEPGKDGKKGKAVKDEQGKYIFDGVEPQVVVWNAPQSVGSRLAFLESQRGGLTNHVCTIHRTHDNTNPWMIDIVDADKKPEEFEEKLYAKKVEPPQAITQLGRRSIPLMSPGDMRRAFSGVSVASGFAERAQGQAQPDNPYQQAADSAAGRGHVNPGAFS